MTMTSFSLEGKVAIVSGGSRGIGRAIAVGLAEAGANVVVAARKANDLAETERMIRDTGRQALSVETNIREAAALENLVRQTTETFGGVHILVNNAATNPYMGPLMGIDVGRADKTVKVNQLGVLVWTQRAYEAAMKERGGAVINIASVGGFGVETSIAYYNVTKAAVIHMTRQMAAELAPATRVNAIAPGLVKTDMAKALWEPNEGALGSRTPLGRLGEPEDIANAALFLASDAASWITGQTLVVDGGATIRPGG